MMEPWTLQLAAGQHTPLLHAPSPWQVTWQTSTESLHWIGASHAEPPSQRTSHAGAAHSMPPPHALAFKHWTAHRAPAHRTLPPQLDGPLHSTTQALAVVQSTPDWHAELALHFTLQSIPSGHLTPDLQPSPLEQSKTHVVPSHVPPSLVQRASHGAPV